MLDYAAFGTAHWGAETFHKFLDETYSEPNTHLLEFLGGGADPEAFLETIHSFYSEWCAEHDDRERSRATIG